MEDSGGIPGQDGPTCAATEKTPLPPTHGRLARALFGDVPLAVADSLRREPDRWSVDYRVAEYQGWISTINRDDKIELWVGNGSYGMTVTGFGGKWGDVTMASTFRLSPGHRLLRCAADRWLARQRPFAFRPHGALLTALTAAREHSSPPSSERSSPGGRK